MRNKYYIVNVPPWGKVYYIVNLPGGGVNLLWGKVYCMTPALTMVLIIKGSNSFDGDRAKTKILHKRKKIHCHLVGWFSWFMVLYDTFNNI